MSSDMNLSSILQSELYCTPTQVVLVDVCPKSDCLKSFVDSLQLSDDSTLFPSFSLSSTYVRFYTLVVYDICEDDTPKFAFQKTLQRLSRFPASDPVIPPFCAGFLDYLNLSMCMRGVTMDTDASPKAQYQIFRETLLSRFLALFSKRCKQGTRERCVIIFVGEVDDLFSRTCLAELSIDVGNLVFWKTGHLPGVLRFAFSSASQSSSLAHMKAFQALLAQLKQQYFDTPKFESESTKRAPVAANGSSSTSTSPQSTVRSLCVNPYDIVACATSFEPLERLFKEIFALHKLETEYALKHLSNEYGSGGSLYLVESRLVSSVSGWRRVDWLVLAQSLYLPRFWCLDDENTLQEFKELFNYRHWVSRFDGLEEMDQTHLEIVSFPDSDRKCIKQALKSMMSSNKLQRRKREAGWSQLHTIRTLSDVKHVAMPSNASKPGTASAKNNAPSGFQAKEREKGALTWNPMEEETNSFRINASHFDAFRELITFLNREERYKEAIEVFNNHIHKTFATQAKDTTLSRPLFSTPSPPTSKSKKKATTKSSISSFSASTPTVPSDFMKLEGVSLLGAGLKDEAIEVLSRYRDYLESEEEDRQLLRRSGDNELDSAAEAILKADSSRVWSEVASVYHACGNPSAAQTLAAKALRLDATNVSAQKTLLMAIGRTGISSFEEEDWVFSFFASTRGKTNVADIMTEASAYYAKRALRYETNGYFWYGYAMFTFVLARDFDAAEPLFEKAMETLPNGEARISESFATFLFQSHSPNVLKIKQLYDHTLLHDPSNLVARANAAAFLLFFRASQLAMLEDNQNAESQLENFSTLDFEKNGFRDTHLEEANEGRKKVQKTRKNSKNSGSGADGVLYGSKEVEKNVRVPVKLNAEEMYALNREELSAAKNDILDGFDEAQALLESVLFSVSLLTHHPQIYLECWFYVLCYTVEKARATQALQYLKASLRKGLRARNWDMAMHIRFLKRQALLSSEDVPWISRLLGVIGDLENLDVLDDWPLWKSLKSDKLVSNLKLAPNSFKVCVSPSKRRELKEEGDVSPPPLARRAKSVPIPFSSSISASSSSTITKSTTIAPKKLAFETVEKRKRATPPAKANNPNSTTPTTVTPETTTTPKLKSNGGEEEDDILNLLDTSTTTPHFSPATSSLTEFDLPRELQRTSSAGRNLSGNLRGASSASLSSSTGAGSVLFSDHSSPSLSSLSFSKSKSPTLSSTTSKNTSKSNSSRRKSPNAHVASSTPTISQETEAKQQQMVWDRILGKYKDENDDEVLGQLSHASPSAPNSGSPTVARKTVAKTKSPPVTASFDPFEFQEEVPKRPTRSVSEVVPMPSSKRRKLTSR